MVSIAYPLLAFSISLALSVALTPLVRRLSIKLDYVANPRQDRWHSRPTGLLGGISIFASFLVAWQAAAAFAGPYADYVVPMLPLLTCAFAAFGVGLIDDIFEINPQYKLVFQVIIASVLVSFGFHIGWFDSRTANIIVSIFWLVGITNAFNLLDNMDGLAPGIAFISGLFLFLWLTFFPEAHLLAEPSRLLLGAFLGSILGFLFYNFNPASIFMGDAGSLFIGFVLASLTVIKSPAGASEPSLINRLLVIAIPCFILFVPILDTAFVSLMRKLVARSMFQGGRDHSSHRMVAVGLSERRAVILLYVFAGVSGAIALGIYRLGFAVSIVIMAAYLVAVLLFWTYLGKVKVYGEEAANTEGTKSSVFFSRLAADGYVRMLFAILLDLILIALAYYLAYLLRFEGNIGPNFRFFIMSLPIMFASQVFSLYFFGGYQRLWHGSRLADLSVYVKAVTAGAVTAMMILLFIYRFQSFSRAVFVIYWGLMLIFILFSRFFFRLADEWISRGSNNGTPVLIYGAGIGGQMLARELEHNDSLGLSVAGFLDDDPYKKGKKFYGYLVFGGIGDLEKILRKQDVREIIISFKVGADEKMKEISRLCSDMGREIVIRQMKLQIC
jgi:UDP-GlcNAc:undecaprenyl-phosphate GlcNAc-1-phosphate transferase